MNPVDPADRLPESPTGDSFPALPAGAPPLPEPPVVAEENRRAAPSLRLAVMSNVFYLLALLLVLVAVSYLVPRMVEDIQYAVSRGQQRAKHDAAGQALANASLKELSAAYQLISERVGPSVVVVNAVLDESAEMPDDETHRRLLDDRFMTSGQGSGMIADADGFIVTNKHVVDGGGALQVRLSDGRTIAAELIGVDALTDLAVLKIDADGLTPAEWGDSDALAEGALVWAVGCPFGLECSITFGILSAKDRAGLAGTPHQKFLQTDAAVNPGNSGGPLVDAEGRVVGINTAIIGQSYRGISFAVPSNVARNVYQQLKSQRRVARGWLGVQLGPLTAAEAARLGLEDRGGAVIRVVVGDADGPSPAQRAGVERGDVVIRWNDHPIAGPTELSQAVAATPIGSTAEMVVLRGDRQHTLHVDVGDRSVREP